MSAACLRLVRRSPAVRPSLGPLGAGGVAFGVGGGDGGLGPFGALVGLGPGLFGLAGLGLGGGQLAADGLELVGEVVGAGLDGFAALGFGDDRLGAFGCGGLGL